MGTLQTDERFIPSKKGLDLNFSPIANEENQCAARELMPLSALQVAIGIQLKGSFFFNPLKYSGKSLTEPLRLRMQNASGS